MRDPDGDHDGADAASPTMAIGRLRRRSEFLRAAKGKRWHGKAFSLQVSHAAEDKDAPARFGLTVTKKVGNAVVRNRARRRLREAIRLHGGLPVRPGRDYVFVARIDAIRLPFATLQGDLTQAMRSVHADSPGSARHRRREMGAPRRKHDAADHS